MLLRIDELEKPKNTWCTHCTTRRGCDIYLNRPKSCSVFQCGWLSNEDLGPEWKPSRCKIVLSTELDGNRLAAYVHPNRPDAWRKEPFYSGLKEWSTAAVPFRGQVTVSVGREIYVIFPDKDVYLGVVEDDDLIVTREKHTAYGIDLTAEKIKRDDPLAQNLTKQNWNIAKRDGD